MSIILLFIFFSFYCYLYTEHRDICRHRAISQMTVRELKASLKAKGHKGFSKLKKADLVLLLLA